MAEHPHAKLIRQGYEAFSRGDLKALSELFTKDVTHHVPGNSKLSGHYKGMDAVLGHYQTLFTETGGTMRVELKQVLVDGRGHAMTMHRTTAERGGKKFDGMGGIIFRIVGDKVTDLDQCEEDLDIGDEFWA